MRTKKKYSLPKPLIDFSNVDTSFANKMKPLDDEKNGKLNLVLVEKSTKTKTKTKTKTNYGKKTDSNSKYKSSKKTKFRTI